MIGWLQGRVQELHPEGLIVLNVQGVGYELSSSMQTLSMIKTGQAIELYVHTHVREDQLQLFGFYKAEERTLFRQLNSVSGIGARMALALLSSMSATELLHAIEQADTSMLCRTPGIGKKTAQRMILELQGKLVSHDAQTNSRTTPLHADVQSALENLGYKPAAISKALQGIPASDNFESLFKACLKALG